MDARRAMDCPSAQPDMQDARPLGVVGGTSSEVRIAFFKRDALAAFDWRARFSSPEATHVLRFAARCEESRCGHFTGSACGLGHRVREKLHAVVDALRPCLVRTTCRWHIEQGDEVCLRCPQVATMVSTTQNDLAVIALGP